MSHLGELLSALIDGELSGTELDRANAHLAACGACRVEANALRRLKQELRALAPVTDAEGITARLLALASEGAPAAPAAPVPVRQLVHEHGGRRGRRRLRGRGRYALWGTVSLVVVGIGSAAFGMGGGSTGPRITPQIEVFDVQHAITAGDVPFAGPGEPADVSARILVGAARPR
jgi:anti-sigma factor RsiW